jgi:hypothetical protein
MYEGCSEEMLKNSGIGANQPATTQKNGRANYLQIEQGMEHAGGDTVRQSLSSFWKLAYSHANFPRQVKPTLLST